jgi:hypothetical protein
VPSGDDAKKRACQYGSWDKQKMKKQASTCAGVVVIGAGSASKVRGGGAGRRGWLGG